MSSQLIPFTSETARAAGLKAAENKRRRKAQAELLEATLQAEERAARVTQAGGDDYIARRLHRVRAALDRYDDLLLTECDPQKASWLATVIHKLSDLERILAGRPAPGNYRPTAPKRRSGNGTMTAAPE